MIKIFDEAQKLKVWQKGQVVTNYDPNRWRIDQCSAWMDYTQYGIRNSLYGWEIDHIIPLDRGGSYDISNLQPLQWENNASKQNSSKLICSIRSQGNINVKI